MGDARLAVDVFVHHLRKTLGAYMVQLEEANAITFTGGIGENSPEIRERVCSGLEKMGIRIDKDRNMTLPLHHQPFHHQESRVQLWRITANEELAIAREVQEALSGFNS